MPRYCFTSGQIADMGARHQSGEPSYKIAATYGCSEQTINRTLRMHDLFDGEIRYGKRTPAAHKQQMVDRYLAGESMGSIARDYGVTGGAVRYVITKRGVTPRPAGRQPIPEERLEWIREQRLAGRTHVSIATELGIKPHTVQALCRYRLGLGPDRRASGANHHAWRGGRRVDGNGYVQLYIPVGDPMYSMATSLGYVPEHRLVMARSLGRPLTRKETVHHVNGDTTDNRLQNLQLRQGGHGKGVVMACLDCGSHNVGHVPLK